MSSPPHRSAPAADHPHATVGPSVAVADDDADIRGLVALTLRRRGYRVLEASAGDEALALIRAHRPALAVLDVMMPGLTGLEVARAICADSATAAIPVLLITASGQDAGIAAGLEETGAAYLAKPFSTRDLAARVTALIGNERVQTEHLGG